jgi:adenine/guanine/hypoxanthine permease
VMCLVGGVTIILGVVPIEATLGILLWIGIIITAQAFGEVPKQHGLAVALGIMPSLAAWAEVLIETTLTKAGTNLLEVAPRFGSDLFIHGVLALNQGFMLSSMALSAILVLAIELEFMKAALWALVLAGLSFVGLVHAYRITPGGVVSHFGWAAAPEFALAYAGAAAALAFLHIQRRWSRSVADPAGPEKTMRPSASHDPHSVGRPHP